MVVRWTSKAPHEHDPIRLHRYDLGHCRGGFFIPDDDVYPGRRSRSPTTSFTLAWV